MRVSGSRIPQHDGMGQTWYETFEQLDPLAGELRRVQENAGDVSAGPSITYRVTGCDGIIGIVAGDGRNCARCRMRSSYCRCAFGVNQVHFFLD